MPNADVAGLPRSVIRYGGDEPGASWRKEAAERIERYRKGDLAIKVTNRNGKPLPGAEVAVHMIRHAFSWGTATNSQVLLDSVSSDSKKYRDTLLKYFNQVVFENEIKTKNWQHIDYGQTSGAIQWLKDHHMKIRGHVMVWPSWQNSGPAFAKFRNDTAGLRKEILKIIAEQTTRLKGAFDEWDVINEPSAHHDFMDMLGREEMVNWFKAARANAPGVKLFLNEYTMFHGEGATAPSEVFFNTIKYLQTKGTPIDAIGEQGHIGGTPPSIPKVLERLDHFSRLGLPIQTSEFDINSNDDEFKARYLRDFMTAVFSTPAAVGFVQWGFWEKQHWFPVAALWNEDWSPRANGKIFTELVNKTWHTEAKGITGLNGRYQTRGFNGDYEVVINYKGKKIVRQLSLDAKGKEVDVKTKW